MTGRAAVGHTLTAKPGSWSGTAPVSYTYQWQMCTPACANIPGQTAGTMTPASAQAGGRIDVVVTAANSAGHASAASNQVGPVQPSASQVRSALHALSTKHTKGKKPGFTLSFRAPSAGRLQVALYEVPKGAHLAAAHARPVLLATANALAHGAGPMRVKLALTAKGRALLTRSVKVSAKATFTPSGASPTTVIIARRL